MKRFIICVLAGMLLLPIATGGWAAEPAGISPATKAEPPSWKTSSLVEETATVEAIDHATRIVTLKGPKGNSVTFKASDEVRNLAQVKAGDEVKFAYYESLAVRVLNKGEAFPAASESSEAARAKKGDMPSGVVGKEMTANVTITAIDKATKTATLKREDGKSVTLTPLRPEKLDEVKVGDRLVLTYTEAVAIKVEKAEKKE
jgi:hypothetical protein